MTRCDWENKRCDNYGYYREDEDRYLCMEHYEAKKKIQKRLNRAFKAAGLSEVDFSQKESKTDK